MPETQTNYFTDRAEAGKQIAKKLEKYRYDDTVVLSLSQGGVLVGAEIARELHSLIALLLTRDILLPDGKTVIGAINETGGFVYNNAFSAGEIEDFTMEYRGHIEQSKMQAVHELHVALGQGGEISPEYFRYRTVIVVTDGAINGTAFDMASDFLKKISTKKIVMVSPIASVEAIDRMHVLADELICLNTTQFVNGINHYYNDNTLPNPNQTVAILNDIILNWSKENKSIIATAK
jgi:putative phosphoribosyl transferase